MGEIFVITCDKLLPDQHGRHCLHLLNSTLSVKDSTIYVTKAFSCAVLSALMILIFTIMNIASMSKQKGHVSLWYLESSTQVLRNSML